MAASADIHDYVLPQIEGLYLDPKQPLLCVDADEVIFNFMAHFSHFLHSHGYRLRLERYHLQGAIRDAEDASVDSEATQELLYSFFAEETVKQRANRGARQALRALSRYAQIVVLSNIPVEMRNLRESNLRNNGMPFPVIANIGPKGPALAAMASRVPQAAFVDDSPVNINSAKQHAPKAWRVHFIADARLRKLAGPVKAAHCSPTSWEQLYVFLSRFFLGELSNAELRGKKSLLFQPLSLLAGLSFRKRA